MKNEEMIHTIYSGLQNLVNEIVFVGGAIMDIYIDDEAAEPPRETMDVDIVIEAVTQSQYDKLEEKLRMNGFKNVIEGPKCRFQYKNVLMDLMSVNDIPGSITNIWFNDGFQNRIKVSSGNMGIQIFPVEYFIASKLEAFKTRGNNDLFKSHDFEDIIYVLDGNKSIENSLNNSGSKVLNYFKKEFRLLLGNPSLAEAVSGSLSYNYQPERVEKIINILKNITYKTE